MFYSSSSSRRSSNSSSSSCSCSSSSSSSRTMTTNWGYHNMGIKHGFSCINIRQVPWEVLKTEVEGLPRDLTNVYTLPHFWFKHIYFKVTMIIQTDMTYTQKIGLEQKHKLI